MGKITKTEKYLLLLTAIFLLCLALLYFTDGDGVYPHRPDYETVFILAGPKKQRSRRLPILPPSPAR